MKLSKDFAQVRYEEVCSPVIAVGQAETDKRG